MQMPCFGICTGGESNTRGRWPRSSRSISLCTCDCHDGNLRTRWTQHPRRLVDTRPLIADWRNSTCDCSKIYHITLIVCAPYFYKFVNLNNNTFQLKTLCSFTFTAKENKKSSPIIKFTAFSF